MNKPKIKFQGDNFIIKEDIEQKKYSKEWFYDQFITKNKSEPTIAKELNLSIRSVSHIATHFNIKKDIVRIKYYFDYFTVDQQVYTLSWFTDNFVNNKITNKNFASILNIPVSYVTEIAKHYGLKKKSRTQFFEEQVIVNNQPIIIQELKQKYLEESLSIDAVAEYFHVSNNKITEILHHYHIEKTPEQREKTRGQTNLKKYGFDSLLQVPEFKEKRRQTCLEHWGNESPLNSEKWRQKRQQELDYIFVHQKNMKHLEDWQEETRFVNIIKQNRQTAFYWADYFNVHPSVIHKRINELNLERYLKAIGGTSKYEEELYNFLIQECEISENDIKRHIRHGIFQDRREVDLYLPKYKFGIEFNGNFFHSSAVEKFQDHSYRSTKHQIKSLDALDAGVFLFHIFEYEWENNEKKEKIKARIKNILGIYSQKIGARLCQIVVLNKKEKKAFLNQNHIQGNDHSSIALGLKYQQKIVACMSFTLSKNKKYNWELSRFCCLQNYLIPGAASKLLKYFVLHYAQDGQKIVSYNDISKTKGKLYEKLGFQFVSINPPNYIWINFNTRDIKTRYQVQQANEKQIMTEKGYYTICDCGTKTWVYEIKKNEGK